MLTTFRKQYQEIKERRVNQRDRHEQRLSDMGRVPETKTDPTDLDTPQTPLEKIERLERDYVNAVRDYLSVGGISLINDDVKTFLETTDSDDYYILKNEWNRIRPNKKLNDPINRLTLEKEKICASLRPFLQRQAEDLMRELEVHIREGQLEVARELRRSSDSGSNSNAKFIFSTRKQWEPVGVEENLQALPRGALVFHNNKLQMRYQRMEMQATLGGRNNSMRSIGGVQQVSVRLSALQPYFTPRRGLPPPNTDEEYDVDRERKDGLDDLIATATNSILGTRGRGNDDNSPNKVQKTTVEQKEDRGTKRKRGPNELMDPPLTFSDDDLRTLMELLCV